MKKKTATYRFAFFAVFGVSFILLTSCTKKDPLPPLVEFYGALDQYKITFKVKSANVNTYSWDFGDSTKSTEREPVHNYLKGGAYLVTLNVKGDGGETTREKAFSVNIPIEELLTGGPGAINGKTWVMTDIYTPGIEGIGPMQDDLKILQDAFDNALNYFRLADQYKDEYTFFYDGSYKVNPAEDGLVLASMIFGEKTGTLVKPSRLPLLLPLCASSYNPPAGGTWALDYNDFTIPSIVYSLATFSYVESDVTFHIKDSGNKVARLLFSDGQYIGFMSYSPVFIVKKISASSMNIAIGITTVADYWDKPFELIQFSFVPKK